MVDRKRVIAKAIADIDVIFNNPKYLVKSFSCWKIKWRGKYVKMISGKSVWPSLSAAKNALHNHLSFVDYTIYNMTNSYSNLEWRTDIINECLSNGLLEFVELHVDES